MGLLKTKALGADGLRLWVALYGSSSSNAKIGPEIIGALEAILNRIRLSLRFMLGSIDGFTDDKSIQLSPYFIDKYIINEVQKFKQRCNENYEDYRFQAVANEFIQFLQRPLSSNYFEYIKDRLYCGSENQRWCAQKTISTVGLNLMACIAPLLPHLATEFFMFHPNISDPAQVLRECGALLKQEFQSPDEEFLETVAIIGRLRKAFHLKLEGKIPRKTAVIIGCTGRTMRLLRKLQPEDFSNSSELVEALQTSTVTLTHADETDFSITFTPPTQLYCSRCRRFRRNKDEQRCQTCTVAINEAISRL